MGQEPRDIFGLNGLENTSFRDLAEVHFSELRWSMTRKPGRAPPGIGMYKMYAQDQYMHIPMWDNFTHTPGIFFKSMQI